MYAVYALVDPRDNLPFYIGITDDVYTRFIQHLRCDGSNFRRDTRIRSLKSINMMVGMPTLQTVNTVQEARTREAYWIYHYLQLGIALTNNTIPTPQEYSSNGKKLNFAQMQRETEAAVITLAHENKEDAVREMRTKGFGKIATIEKVWGVKRGSSKVYRQAETEYGQIIQQLESEAGHADRQ